MSSLLKDLKLSSENPFDGLVPVNDTISGAISPSEQRIIKEASKISRQIDFIFFRRFTDNIRSSQPVAYIIDNTKQKMSNDDIAHLHHTLWLNGTVPLLYVDNDHCVDVFSCVAGSVIDNPKDWKYKPNNTILETSETIADELKRFSAFNLANGFFWEDAQNKDYVDFKKSSYNVLIEKVEKADRAIDGKNNLTARRLLILTLLIKYLEDRGVFKEAGQFFSKYSNGATSFYDVLKDGTKKNILGMLSELETKFNGDVFSLPNTNGLTKDVLKKVVDVVNAKKDDKGQLYFWNIFNFEHIPIEVLSHIYQYFTRKEKGAIFTPILLVNLMLDQIMPYETIRGNEKIFDPTCGSGVFLVSAFRRLVYAKTRENKETLSPKQLTTLLSKTIFGVEFQEEAARIASFSLALAICDALRPDIIWKELRFEKIIERNIFVGDFAEVGKKALEAIKPSTGFDIIIGNPPFISELTTAIQSDLKKGEKIPDNQIAYYILKRSAEKYLVENGKLCLIQHYGFLYNSNPALLRTSFFKSYNVSKILDFISVNGLFHEAGTTAIALLLSKKTPENNHKIQHLTFRRTVSVKAHLCFELDYYDYHYVSMEDATDKKFPWKANLLGGGRLNQQEYL